ncbi:hypothetical protein COB72_04210 [bacterium]|nr:MAG: hypothetical protein COB72_04210 [bacterium]
MGITDGTVDITAAVELTYDVKLGNPSNGVSFRTSEYSSTATETGTLRVRWNYFAQHKFFIPVYDLIAFADGPGGRVETPVGNWINTSNVDEEGIVELQITDGFDYGFVMGGSNSDSNSSIRGSLTVVRDGGDVSFDNDFSNWTNTGIESGFARSRPAIEFQYDVDLGNPGGGVPLSLADFTVQVPESGQFTCDWNVSAFHAFNATTAHYALIAIDGDGVESEEILFSGDFGPSQISPDGRGASIYVASGEPVGVRAGGSNFDSNSVIGGSVVLSRIIWEPEVCVVDLNNDGQLNFFDISQFLNLFSAGCP